MFKILALVAIFGFVAASADPSVVQTAEGILAGPEYVIQTVPAQQILVAAPAIQYAPQYYGVPVTGKSLGIGIGGGIGVGAGKTLVRIGNGLAVPGVGIGLNAGLGLGLGKTLYGPGGVVLRRPGLGLGFGIRAGLGIGVGKAVGVGGPYAYYG